MAKAKQRTKRTSRRLHLALMVGFLVCMTVWWELFHELARNWILAISWQEEFGSPARFFMTFHCPSRALGIAVGAGLYLWLSKIGRQRIVEKLPFAGWAAVLITIDFLHFVALVVLKDFALACALHVLVNAVLTYGFIGFSQILFERSTRYTVVATIAVASGLVLMNLAVAPFMGKTGNELQDGILSLGLLVAALLCAFGMKRTVAALNTTSSAREKSTSGRSREADDSGPLFAAVRIIDSKEPRALVGHLVMYGAVLGFLHTIGRRIVYGETFATANVVAVSSEGSIPVGVGSLIAIAIVAYLFLRHTFTFPLVWETLRKAVFTLAVLEFLLVPLISTSIPGVIAGDTASTLYLMLFVIGCCLVYKESDCSATGLAAWGLLLLGIGQFAAGVILEYNVRQLLADSEMFAVLRVIGFLLCTVATFWVGTDADIKKLWGLRRDYLPKQYQDKIVREKVGVLGKRTGLTKREQEVLVLLAQGVRADAIGNQLFISPNTVRTHIQNAYGKLDIHSVKELTALLADVTAEE